MSREPLCTVVSSANQVVSLQFYSLTEMKPPTRPTKCQVQVEGVPVTKENLDTNNNLDSIMHKLRYLS